MYNGNTVAAVVPAYNEEGLIGEVIRTLPPFVDRAYVIDDGSTDGTWAEIRENAVAMNSRAREDRGRDDHDEQPDRPAAISAVIPEAGQDTSDEDGAAGQDPERSGAERDPPTQRDGPPRDSTETGQRPPPSPNQDDSQERTSGGRVPSEVVPSTNGRGTATASSPPGSAGGSSTADPESGTGDGRAPGRGPTKRGQESKAKSEYLDPRVVPIKHGRNRGVGAALKTGYRRALADGIDVTAVIAGDGQTAADIVERIVAPVASGKADYAKGNRLLSGDRDAMPRFRQVGNVTLSLLTKVASGYWSVLDSQNGSTAISHEALSALDIDAVYEGYGYCNDILIRLNARNLRVADVFRRAVYEDETSNISLGSYVPSLSALLLRGFCWRLRRKYLIEDTHPLVGFYVLGVLLTVAGLGRAAARLRPGRDRDGGTASARRQRSGSGLLLGSGLFSLLFAMAADREENRDLDFVVRQDVADREEDTPAGSGAGRDDGPPAR